MNLLIHPVPGSLFDPASVSARNHAFVGAEKSGSWAKATPVPGLAALTGSGKTSGAFAVSCASAGHGVAGGSYRDRKNHGQAFVVTEG